MKFASILAVITTSFALVHASTPHVGVVSARRSRLNELPVDSGVKRNSGDAHKPSGSPQHKGHGALKHSGSKAVAAQGLINVKSTCGAIGATSEVTATSGPNGGMDWLNCGITSSGWKPPFMTVNDIIHEDLPVALQDPNSPFRACSAFVGSFEKYGQQFGVPPILLASFALQESSCNPHTIGGAGEQGLMQITKDKCAGAPGGNCLDPDFNIKAGSQYFANMLQANNGDLLKSIGAYNGWFSGMSYNDATAAAHSDCCHCQNNLDYLHQFVNGWVLNVDAYAHNPKLGKYFNLNVCK